MTGADDTRLPDSRVRAARTKRDRTRRALLEAADAAFSSRGWLRTRIEDVATAAGVSAGTAYNHFPSKHALMGHVFAPLINPVVAQAELDRASGRPVVEGLIDQVTALSRISWRNRALTAAFCAAALDYTIRVEDRPDPADRNDPRALAPLPDAIVGLIEHGQRTGELRRYPPAMDVGIAVVNLLLLRSITRKHEPPQETAEVLLTVLFGVLKPELLAAREIDERPFRTT